MALSLQVQLHVAWPQQTLMVVFRLSLLWPRTILQLLLGFLWFRAEDSCCHFVTRPAALLPPPRGGALVAEAAFNSTHVKVWQLGPPHRWGTPAGHWQAVLDSSFVSDTSGHWQLRGLALWHSRAGPQLHAVLAEADGHIFDRGCARELLHRILPVDSAAPAASSTTSSAPELSVRRGSCSEQQTIDPKVPLQEQRADRSALHMVESLAKDVSSMRSELVAMRQGFEGFAQDFRRMTVAIETLTAAVSRQDRRELC